MNGKRILALTMALLLALGLAACTGGAPDPAEPESTAAANTQQPEAEPTAEAEPTPEASEAPQAPPAAPVEIPEGFTVYEDTVNGVRLAYPEDWLEVSAQSMQVPEIQEMMSELLNLDADGAAAALEQIQLYLYDVEKISEEFAPNMNMGITEASGISEGMLTNPLVAVQLKQQIAAQYEGVFENVVWVQDPEGKTLGSTTFLTTVMTYSAYGVDIAAYQAITVRDGMLYTFTFSTTKDLLEGSRDVFEQVLSTVELI